MYGMVPAKTGSSSTICACKGMCFAFKNMSKSLKEVKLKCGLMVEMNHLML
jgi:hypothetical protein